MLGLYISQSNVETRLKWAASARVKGKTATPFSLIEERPVFGRPFSKQFTLSYRTVVSLSVCLSWLSVCPDCLSVLSCLSVTLVYCGQTVGWTKMKLGVQVGIRPGNVVLDEDPAPTEKGTVTPCFQIYGRRLCLRSYNPWPMSIVTKCHLLGR